MEKLLSDYKIEYTKGDTYALSLKFKNITEDLRTAYFTVKENADDSPLIQKSLGAGIDKIEDRAYKNEKTYKFQLQPADTLNLEAKVQYLYDIQVTVGNIVKTVLKGVFVLGNTITGTSGVTTQNLEVKVDDELEVEVASVEATNGVEYEQDPVACTKIGDLSKLETDNKETVVKAINEVNKNADSNAEELNKIKNGTLEVPKAKDTANVTGQINGKNITNIFEEDGTVVKNSTNVTGQINGKNITDIFEENGTTVKNSTNAESVVWNENTGKTQGGRFIVNTNANNRLEYNGLIIPTKKDILKSAIDVESSSVDAELNEILQTGDEIEIYLYKLQYYRTTSTGGELKYETHTRLRVTYGGDATVDGRVSTSMPSPFHKGEILICPVISVRNNGISFSPFRVEKAGEELGSSTYYQVQKIYKIIQ